MSITSAIVFYIVVWAVVFYMVNPFWQTSQEEAGEIVPGTPASAPVNPYFLRKALVTTAIATVAFALLYWIIVWQVITLEDVSWIEPPARNQ